MNGKTKFRAIVIAFLTLSSAAAFADCRQEFRELGETISEKTKLKGFVCRLNGANDASVGIETVTLSNAAASVLVSGGAEAALRKVFGPFVFARNEVSKEYKTLVDRFGMTMDGVSIAGIVVTGRSIVDQIDSYDVDAFPAVDEMMQLAKAIVPENIRVYYISPIDQNKENGTAIF
jgi:hypothetical protein